MHNGLQGILVRFRRNAVGVMCDIEQMFHNFHVHPPHRDLLRFLWFADNDKEKDVIVYQMVVHLFGNTSSPRGGSRPMPGMRMHRSKLRNHDSCCLKYIDI